MHTKFTRELTHMPTRLLSKDITYYTYFQKLWSGQENEQYGCQYDGSQARNQSISDICCRIQYVYLHSTVWQHKRFIFVKYENETLFDFSVVNCNKFELLYFPRQCENIVKVWWKILSGFVVNFILFSVVKEFWKSVKIWESYCQKFGTRCTYTRYCELKYECAIDAWLFCLCMVNVVEDVIFTSMAQNSKKE